MSFGVNGLVLIALCCAVFMLGVTWGYVLVLTFSGRLRKPEPPDPTDFAKCAEVMVTIMGTPTACNRLRGHPMPHQDSDGLMWIPAGGPGVVIR